MALGESDQLGGIVNDWFANAEVVSGILMQEKTVSLLKEAGYVDDNEAKAPGESDRYRIYAVPQSFAWTCNSEQGGKQEMWSGFLPTTASGGDSILQ